MTCWLYDGEGGGGGADGRDDEVDVGEWDGGGVGDESVGGCDGGDDGNSGCESGDGVDGHWGVCAAGNGVIRSGSPMPNSLSITGFMVVVSLCTYVLP